MKRFHLFFGLALLVVFLLTGQYMDIIHHHLAEMADKPRLLMRSRHIYILYSSLAHLALGSYFLEHPIVWRKRLQWLGSTLMTVAAVLVVTAFFTEPWRQGWEMPTTLLGAVLFIGGVMSHAVSGLKRPGPKKPGLRAEG